MNWHGSGWRVALHAFQIFWLTVVAFFGLAEDRDKEEQNKRTMKIDVVMEMSERKSGMKFCGQKSGGTLGNGCF